jgi:hypothetical protein
MSSFRLTYATTAYIGTLNTNYYTTTIGYDDRGRRNRVQRRRMGCARR